MLHDPFCCGRARSIWIRYGRYGTTCLRVVARGCLWQGRSGQAGRGGEGLLGVRQGTARQGRSGEVLHGVVGCLAARLGVARWVWGRLGRAGVVGLVVASCVEA